MMKEILWNFCMLVLFGIWGIVKIYHLYEENQAGKPPKHVALDLNYKDNVSLQIFYMTPEQVGELYKTNIDGVPEHWQFQEPHFSDTWFCSYQKPLYLVVRLKNEGNQVCLGTLSCILPREKEKKVQIIALSPKMSSFVNYTFFLTDSLSLKKLGYPVLNAKWEALYVKPEHI